MTPALSTKVSVTSVIQFSPHLHRYWHKVLTVWALSQQMLYFWDQLLDTDIYTTSQIRGSSVSTVQLNHKKKKCLVRSPGTSSLRNTRHLFSFFYLSIGKQGYARPPRQGCQCCSNTAVNLQHESHRGLLVRVKEAFCWTTICKTFPQQIMKNAAESFVKNTWRNCCFCIQSRWINMRAAGH